MKSPNNQCRFLRFIWQEKIDINHKIVDYKIKTRVYAGILSPSCSNFATWKTAVDNSNLYGWEFANILEKNYYVDDIVKSLCTADETTEVTHKVKELCSKQGFNLFKFTSNKDDELKYTKKTNATDTYFVLGHLPEDRALEVKWMAYEWLKWKNSFITMENISTLKC